MSDLPSRERVAELGCSASSPEEAEDIEAILNAYRVGQLFDRETIDPLIDAIRTWSKAYPVEVFPPPPKGQHAETIDGCHAHAGRHIISRLMELIPTAIGAR